MIKKIGEKYEVVKYVKDKTIVKINNEDYIVYDEWVKFTYIVSEEQDKIVDKKLATIEEINNHKLKNKTTTTKKKSDMMIRLMHRIKI